MPHATLFCLAPTPQVYLGTLNETSVAVKVLTDTSGSSAAGSWASSPALQALHRESSVMAALRHPNVVSCDSGCWLERKAWPLLALLLFGGQPASQGGAMLSRNACPQMLLLATPSEACCATDH